MLRGLSLLLGRQRNLVRRLGALALVAMGVHAGADVLDDVAADAIDAVDLWLDDAVAAVLGGLMARGVVAADAAARGIEAFATSVDLPEKQWIALRVALAIELVLDGLLAPLAWGARDVEGASALDELKRTNAQLRAAFGAVDVERLLVAPTLAVFAATGAVVAGVACEQLARSAFAALAPGLLVAVNLSAAAAIALVGLLLVRFVPDLLHGAIVVGHARGERRRTELAAARARRPSRWPRWAAALDELRRALRGAWLVPAGWLAVHAVDAVGFGPLVERLGAGP